MASKFDSIWVPTLVGAFLSQYEGTVSKNWSEPITRKYENTGEFVKAVEADTVGGVRQWTDKRQFKSPKIYTQVQQNVPFELSFPIDVEDYTRDSLGLWAAKAGEIGQKFGDHINKLVAAMIVANPTCFDGTAFFGTGHPVNGTTQSNDLSSSTSAIGGNFSAANFTGATATAPTALMMSSAIMAAVTWFQNMIDDSGDPINGGAQVFEILTSNPQIYAAGLAAINSLQLSQGQTNPLYAGLEAKGYKFLIAMDPRLGAINSSVFYVARVDSEVKSFIWGEEKALEMQYLGPDSEFAIINNKLLFGGKSVRSVGVGRYQHTLRCTLGA